MTAGVNIVEMGLMRAGDLNGDNAVGITDFNPLKTNYGTGGTQPQGNPGGSDVP